jgi:type IV pilus assembly protein PilP
MDRPIVFIRNFLLIISFIFLVWGCEQKEQSPPKPRGVTKKIVIAEKETSKPQQPGNKTVSKSASLKETTQPASKGVSQTPEPSLDTASQTLVASIPTKRTENEAPETSDLYNPEGRLDPFEPLIKPKPVELSVQRKKVVRRKLLTPLEKLDLSQLKLVGIVRAPSGNRAMIQETSGKGYVVKKGTYIGTHSGKITQILKDRIVLEEEVENIYGNIVVQKKEINLRLPGEE